MSHRVSSRFFVGRMPLPKHTAGHLDIFHCDATRGFRTKENGKSGNFCRVNDPALRVSCGDFGFGLGDRAAQTFKRHHLGQIAVHHFGIDPGGADHHAGDTLCRALQRHAACQAQQPGF